MAILQLLGAAGLSIDAPIAPYLPTGWSPGPNVDALTFRQLLTHTSGLRGGSGTYAELRAHIERGVTLYEKTFAYRSENFTLLRALVPRLDGFDDSALPEPDRERAGAARYLAYLDRAIFSPIGVATGANLSAEELASFLVALNETDVLLTAAQREEMIDLDLGWQGRSLVRHGQVSEHGGADALILSFSAGVQAAVLIDSPAGGTNLRQAALDAYRNAWLPM